MQEQFLFSGFGGQGIMFAGQLLAYAGMNEGYDVTWIPSYGPEMRGGTAHCYVTISDKQIGSPVVRNPRNGVVFNIPSFDKYEKLIAPGGMLASNASLVPNQPTRTDITVLPVPASQIADEMGELKLANVIMLGAILKARPVVRLETVQATLSERLSARRRNLLDLNIEALSRGAEFADRLLQEMALPQP
ncbi:MAG: 2-oxoacid:acceptor oxidoreductase family protein [Anaerolineae bacterium]|nr:2-oxoacid:acceptor oxidoreductase family protein [Anaerolineae bacterium]